MRTIYFNPWREFENLANVMHKAINYAPAQVQKPVKNGNFQPKADIYEDNEGIYFEFELPGVVKEDVKVSVTGEKILSVKGEKKFLKPNEADLCCRAERLYGEFNRSFQLPDYADENNVTAKFENGILNVKIARAEEIMPKETDVTIQ